MTQNVTSASLRTSSRCTADHLPSTDSRSSEDSFQVFASHVTVFCRDALTTAKDAHSLKDAHYTLVPYKTQTATRLPLLHTLGTLLFQKLAAGSKILTTERVHLGKHTYHLAFLKKASHNVTSALCSYVHTIHIHISVSSISTLCQQKEVLFGIFLFSGLTGGRQLSLKAVLQGTLHARIP